MHPIFAWLPHGADWIYLLVIILLLFGGAKLPQLARGLGKSLGEFKKAKEEFEKEILSVLSEKEIDELCSPERHFRHVDDTFKRLGLE